MLDLVPSASLAVDPMPPFRWTAERFLAALHPAAAPGRVSVMLADGDTMHTRTYRPCELDAVAGPLIEAESYVTLNRAHGPRGRSRLAALNACWLDLDVYRIPALAGLERPHLASLIRNRIAAAGLPEPSFLVDSGRGYYVIWLLAGAATAALPRWSAVMRALVAWARPLGADPACIDVARVLRVPESWHHGAGRQVAVVGATGERCEFEVFADAVWRASRRPTRTELESHKARRAIRAARSGAMAAASPVKLRGLPRGAFWRLVLDDLERLLAHWGGTVPLGLRDLWLHLWVTALGWTAVEIDLAACVVAKAALVAPGMTAREVRRTMSTTIRRAEATAARQRRARYDYGGSRMADLLGVDRALAEALGLRQIVPLDLRADRRQASRVARRRAAGALPRAIWLAAHPTERERPWEAEGISRATWYRRLAKIRDRRRRARSLALLGASAMAPRVDPETGPVSLYGGFAPPSAATRRPEVPGQSPDLEIQSSSSETPAAWVAPLALTAKNAPPGNDVSVRGRANPNPAKAPGDPARQEAPGMPLVDPEILALAAHRLSAPDLGNLTRIAVELAGGPNDRLQLGWRLRFAFDELDRLAPWLETSADGRTVIGLRAAPLDQAIAGRKPRQGSLFTEAEFAPPPSPRMTGGACIKKAIIDQAIVVMAASDVPASRVRSVLGGLFRDHGLGLVAEAVHELSRIDVVADPVAWLGGFLRRRKTGSARPAASSTGNRSSAAAPATPADSRARPLATPEFLGVSPARAAAIHAQNSNLRLTIVPRGRNGDGDEKHR